MKIGAQLFTVKKFTQTPKDIAETFEKLSKIGFDTIQVSGICPMDPKELKDMAESNNLEIALTHTSSEDMLTNVEKTIEFHQILGCKNIGLGSMPKTCNRYSEDDVRKFISEYGASAAKMAEAGFKFHYHNHAFEFQRFGSKTGWDIIAEETDPKIWNYTIDTYWLQYGGKDPAKVMRSLAGRIEMVHLKDFAIVENEIKMAEVMEGNLDFDSILKACEDIDAKYALIEQDDCYGADPFKCLETSFTNLKDYYAKAGK